MSQRFTVHEDDKRLHIVQEDHDYNFNIEIDYDDVYHPETMKKAKLLCKILNEHWPKEKS